VTVVMPLSTDVLRVANSFVKFALQHINGGVAQKLTI